MSSLCQSRSLAAASLGISAVPNLLLFVLLAADQKAIPDDHIAISECLPLLPPWPTMALSPLLPSPPGRLPGCRGHPLTLQSFSGISMFPFFFFRAGYYLLSCPSSQCPEYNTTQPSTLQKPTEKGKRPSAWMSSVKHMTRCTADRRMGAGMTTRGDVMHSGSHRGPHTLARNLGGVRLQAPAHAGNQCQRHGPGGPLRHTSQKQC